MKSESLWNWALIRACSKFSCQFHPVEVQFPECLLPGNASSISISSWEIYIYIPFPRPFVPIVFIRLIDRRNCFETGEPTIGKHDSYRYNPPVWNLLDSIVSKRLRYYSRSTRWNFIYIQKISLSDIIVDLSRDERFFLFSLSSFFQTKKKSYFNFIFNFPSLGQRSIFFRFCPV